MATLHRVAIRYLTRTGHSYIFLFIPMGIVYNPLFREAVVLAAIILLAVFCVDKSRQNQRTRNALYNCVYVLYVAAAAKSVQFLEHLVGNSFASACGGMCLLVLAAYAYWRWVKPQDDIPFNKVFYGIGWLAMVILLIVQATVLVMMAMRPCQE